MEGVLQRGFGLWIPESLNPRIWTFNLLWRKPGNMTAVKWLAIPPYQLGTCIPVLDPELKTLCSLPSSSEKKDQQQKHEHRTAATPSTPPTLRCKPGLPQGQGKNTPAYSPSNPTSFRAHQRLLVQTHCSSSHSPASLGHAGTPPQRRVMQLWRSLSMSCKGLSQCWYLSLAKPQNGSSWANPCSSCPSHKRSTLSITVLWQH